MPRGGARQGAGRPKGSKDSKPRKITVRTLDDVKRVKARAMNEGKILPLDLFMDVLNDTEADDAARMEAAKAAAPYMHPRLQAVAFSGGVTHKTREQSLIELDALAEIDPLALEANPVLRGMGHADPPGGNGADRPHPGNGAGDPAAAEGSGDDLAGLATVAGLADDAGQVD